METKGTIQSVPDPEGRTVCGGAVVMAACQPTETEQLRADLAQAREEIERLKEAVAENKSDEEDAKINYQRWRDCEAERDTLQARVEQLEKENADLRIKWNAVLKSEDEALRNCRKMEQQVAALSKPMPTNTENWIANGFAQLFNQLLASRSTAGLSEEQPQQKSRQ